MHWKLTSARQTHVLLFLTALSASAACGSDAAPPADPPSRDAAMGGEPTDKMGMQDAALPPSVDAGVAHDAGADGGHADASPPAPTPRFSSDPGPIDTAIVRGPLDPQTDGTESRFELSCNRSTCSFEYSLDGADYAACAGTLTFQTLPVGSHELRVRARDEAGKQDASPASYSWHTQFAYRSLASSSGTSCAISNDGKLYCWGSDEYGALFGTGSTSEVRDAAPRRIGEQLDWRSIVGADYGYCAINAANEVYCWGSGKFGASMVNDITLRSPTRVTLPARSLSFGSDHGCGLDAGGHLWCWGDNSESQLGVDVGDHSDAPVQVGDKTWRMVSTGAYHTCAIDELGALYCFGEDYSGECGIDPALAQMELVRSPTRVGSDSDWAQVSCAESHCCGLKTDHSLYCWGDNSDYALGVGTLPERTHTPRRVGNDSWQLVAALESGTCATKTTGAAYCWGPNAVAQLGNTTVIADHASIPARLSADRAIQQFTGSDGHRCALASGQALCWGDNNNADGALGRGVFGRERNLAKLDAGWSKLSMRKNGGCGVRTDGALQCWGVGQHVATSDIPLRYSPAEVDASRDWVDVAVSTGTGGNDEHACGLRAGAIYCWGSNTSGRLGDGSGQNHATPVAIYAPSVTFAQLSVGDASACAITGDGRLYCWGANDSGQLGDGTTTDRATPVAVQTPAASGWSKVQVMGKRVSAIREDGTLWAWGSSAGSVSNNTPTQLGSSANWVSVISTFQQGTCAINAAQELHCTTLTYSSGWARALGKLSGTSQISHVFDATNGVCMRLSDGSQQCLVDYGSGWMPIARPDWSVASGAVAPAFTRWTGGYSAACALTTDGERYCSGQRFAGSFGDGFDERLPSLVLPPH